MRMHSDKPATEHWLVIRVTAVLAIPFTLWFVYSIVRLAGADYETARAWFHVPMNAVFIMFFVLIAFYHAVLGHEEIIEDYVQQPLLKKIKLASNAVLCSFIAALCIFSVLKIVFTPG